MNFLEKFWKQNKNSIIALVIILAGVGYAIGQMHQRNKMDTFDASQKIASVRK